MMKNLGMHIIPPPPVVVDWDFVRSRPPTSSLPVTGGQGMGQGMISMLLPV